MGPDLDKAFPPRVPCAFSGLLFSRIRVVRLFVATGKFQSPHNLPIHTYPVLFLSQNPIVSTITTVFTAFSSFGLAAVSTWFASERLVFTRHRGQKWLQDSLDDGWDALISIPPFYQFIECLHVLGIWASSISRRMRSAATNVSSVVTSVFNRRSVKILHPSSSENSFPRESSQETVILNQQSTRRGSEVNFTASPVPSATVSKSIQGSTVSFTLPSEKSSGITSTSASPSPSRVRFIRAVRNVIRMQQATMSCFHPTQSLSPTLIPDGTRQKDTQPTPVQSSRVAGLIPKLRGLTPTQDLVAHQALVRHMQFSPNGKFLATSRFVFLVLALWWEDEHVKTDDIGWHSWDHTSVIFRTGVSTYPSSWLVCCKTFDRIPLPSIGRSLTPLDSSVKSCGRASFTICSKPLFLMRIQVANRKFCSDEADSFDKGLDGGLFVVTFLVTSADLACIQAGVCSRTIDRYRSVQSMCWMPGGEGKPPRFSPRYTAGAWKAVTSPSW